MKLYCGLITNGKQVLVILSPLVSCQYSHIEVNSKSTQQQLSNASLFARLSRRLRNPLNLNTPENQFRTLADAIPHLCWVADSDGWIFWYNQRWYEYTGSTPRQMEGWGWQSVHNPETLPAVMEKWQASIATGTPFDMVFPLLGADGIFRPFLTRVVPVHDRKGKLSRWFGTNTDIGEQRKTEQALRESEERFRLAQQVARVGTFDWDIETGVNRWTRELEAMYGLMPGSFESTEAAWEKLVHADDRPQVQQKVQLSMETGTFEGEWRVLWPDNSLHWFHGRASVFKNGAGKPARMVGVHIEITESKLAEQALQDSEVRYQTLTEALPAIVYTTTAEGVTDYINCRWREYTGLSFEESRNVGFEAPIHPDDREQVASRWVHALATGEAYDHDFRLQRADGVYRWFHLNAVPLHDPHGNVKKWLGISSDIDGEKTASDRLRQSQKMEAIGRLAAGVAHDFNNLLTAIFGFNSMLIEELAEQPELLGFATEVQGAAERASALTHQLLTFSRRDVSKPKTIQLNDVVLSMRTLLSRVIGEHIDIATFLRPDMEQVRLDPVQLDQVIMNLAVNARDAMPDGGRLIFKTDRQMVCPELARNNSAAPGLYVTLQVTDNGSGMNTETSSRLFEPFFTTKEEGKGTGLGLATVYGILQQNKGFITVESKPGAGATFKVYFPAATGADPESNVAIAPETIPAAGNNRTLVLVEDDATVRKFAATLLSRQGFRTLDAATPSQALALVKDFTQPIFALITDVLMPEMRGTELAQQINELRPGIPVVYMSGYSGRTFLSPDVLKGAFLQKPFTATELAEALQKAVHTQAAP